MSDRLPDSTRNTPGGPSESITPRQQGQPGQTGQTDQTGQRNQGDQNGLANRPPHPVPHGPSDRPDLSAAMRPSDQTGQPDGRRRMLLKAIPALFAAAAAGLWTLLPARAREAFAARFPTRTVEDEAPRFDPESGMVRTGGRSEPYRLVIDGLVERPVRLSYAELRALPQVRRTADFHCVEGWSVADAPWGGVDFPTLFSRVRPLPGARFVHFHSLGRTQGVGGLTHYVESFPLADLLNPELGALLALDLDGRPLTDERGAPARVVSPFDLAYKSIKFVARIEFAAAPVDGWWTRANPIYPSSAPVPAGRLRTPDPRRRRTTRP